jgi:hypothetical protein
MCILLVSVKSGLAIPADKPPVERPLNILWVERGLRQETVYAIAQHSNASLSFGAILHSDELFVFAAASDS